MISMLGAPDVPVHAQVTEHVPGHTHTHTHTGDTSVRLEREAAIEIRSAGRTMSARPKDAAALTCHCMGMAAIINRRMLTFSHLFFVTASTAQMGSAEGVSEWLDTHSRQRALRGNSHCVS